MSKSIINILHLSDLHFGVEPSEKVSSTAVDQRNLVLTKLINILEALDTDWRPHAVAITGDIGWKGIPADYEMAGEWLNNKLLPALNLTPEKLVICPGNHDIDRNKTFGMTPPMGSETADNWLKLEHTENFSRPFEAYDEFCKNLGIAPPKIHEQPNFLSGALNIDDIDGIRFIVLNSAWFCRGEEDKNKLWLGKPLLEKMAANNQLLEENGHDAEDSPITLVLFHHPNDWLNEYEYNTFGNRQNTLEYLCLRSHIILNGHVHARPTKPHRLFNVTWQIKGGAAYAGNEYLNHFSILRIDTGNRKFVRLAYEFDPGKNKWREEVEDTYNLKKSSGDMGIPLLAIPGKYKEWIQAQCKDMDITKLAVSSSVIQVSLPEIYIPLFTNSLDKNQEKREPVDIENLIPDHRALVIHGRAGSGKTTLVKHFTYKLIQSGNWKGLDGWLPVLIFLKDLKDFDTSSRTGNADTARELLAYWSNLAGGYLDIKTILGYCEAGKTVIFLDGLDEINESLRELVVISFHRLKIEYEDCKFILSGRPHGVDDTVRRWFGEGLVEILTLSMLQVEEFIFKWFEHVFESERYGVKKTAEEMIGEIKSHPSIDELIDSPLMLTAICLLYADEKVLPGQRAELYDRFVENLLHKRFYQDKPLEVRNYLMALALEMHQKRTKNISRAEAVRILGDKYKKYKKTKDETVQEYNDRLNSKFDKFEPACGLLKLEKGGYGFIHLTFQEFLTANALVAGESGNHFKTIATYWDDDWYREVVQLYIGYLSIKSSAMANDIVQKILEENEDKPFARRLLAVRSFIDIHGDNRKDPVIETAASRLWEIIESDTQPAIRAEAGELLGRLGDDRDLEVFIPIPDGTYETSSGNVTLNTFEMAKYPVTNRWFRKFIQDGGYTKLHLWSDGGQKWLDHTKNTHPNFWYDHKWNCENLPVVGVCWWEADAFCRWLTKTRNDGWCYRLPTEQEWEAAAAGKERREYPWEKTSDNYINCNTLESEIKKTSAVGIFRDGDTPEGLSDMSGNVWEWTCTKFIDSSQQKDFPFNDKIYSMLTMVRGGAWGFNRFVARCRNQPKYTPDFRITYGGFRCART